MVGSMKFPPRHLAAAALIALAAPLPAQAASLLDYVGQCVPFARAASGLQIYGDAWTWWDQAKGRYRRGSVPKVGAVIVFAKTGRLPLGHVGVISRIVDSRVAMITQANWSVIDGEHGHAEQDVTLFDVSKDNDWSEVRVWYKGMEGLGSTTFPIYGFIYGTPASGAPDGVRAAHPAKQLTGKHPDYVGALIDAYAPTWHDPSE